MKAIRACGLVLLAYTLAMTFLVPLGPGLDQVEVLRSQITEQGGQYELRIAGLGTHFSTSQPKVFITARNILDGEQTVLSATHLKVADDTHLLCRVRLPKVVPAMSWNVYVNGAGDGTVSYANGFYATGLEAAPKSGLKDDKYVLSTLQEADLPFHFPFQPNIMESIRNLMLHVPMWFTMFLLMGISFAQSLRVLRLGGNPDRDRRAVAAVKVGLWFGVLGLLTGSLWARWTWGAWWVDDPQLNGAFVTVMVYAGYLVLRGSIQEPKLRERLAAVYNLFGFLLLVVLLMVLPRFTESLHPGKGGNPAFSSYDLDSALRAVFYPAVLGWMILGTWMYAVALKVERLRANLDEARTHRGSWRAQLMIPALLLPAQATQGGQLEALFFADGKMPVVVGVAVIIGVGLTVWWAIHLRRIRQLQLAWDALPSTDTTSEADSQFSDHTPLQDADTTNP
ncbi:MAG: cytochrome c biogenesis protein CcsA [Bacteroidetes bacterium]|nr:cytochrome c biogenesis protein CcsA [Bacteroidota bacterium]